MASSLVTSSYAEPERRVDFELNAPVATPVDAGRAYVMVTFECGRSLHQAPPASSDARITNTEVQP